MANPFGFRIDEEKQEVHLCLKRYSILKDGAVALSPDCVTIEELKSCIRMLRKDLDVLEAIVPELVKPVIDEWYRKREHPSMRAGRPTLLI